MNVSGRVTVRVSSRESLRVCACVSEIGSDCVNYCEGELESEWLCENK